MSFFLKTLFSMLLFMLYIDNASVMALHSNSMYYTMHHHEHDEFGKPTSTDPDKTTNSGIVEKLEGLKVEVKKYKKPQTNHP